MYSIRTGEDASPGSSLDKLRISFEDLRTRLELREKVLPAEFDAAMKLREETHHRGAYSRLEKFMAEFTKCVKWC
jgi:hypothetical protein